MGRYKEESEKKKEVKYTLEFHPEVEYDIEDACNTMRSNEPDQAKILYYRLKPL